MHYLLNKKQQNKQKTVENDAHNFFALKITVQHNTTLK